MTESPQDAIKALRDALAPFVFTPVVGAVATQHQWEDFIDAASPERVSALLEHSERLEAAELLRAALKEADTIMGHDDAATEWRERWGVLFEQPKDGITRGDPDGRKHQSFGGMK